MTRSPKSAVRSGWIVVSCVAIATAWGTPASQAQSPGPSVHPAANPGAHPGPVEYPDTGDPAYSGDYFASSVPHDVLRSPEMAPPARHSGIGQWTQSPNGSSHPSTKNTPLLPAVDAHRNLHRPIRSAPKLPGGVVQPVYKQPYSYGYFGASSKRHWSRHHGYRDRNIRWTYR